MVRSVFVYRKEKWGYFLRAESFYTVSDDGSILSDDEAVEMFKRTGRHLGVFRSPQSATAYAKKLHEEQARAYVR